MRVRSRENLKKKNIAITGLFLLPIIGFGSYAGIILMIVTDISSYSRDEMEAPNVDFFFDEDSIDEAILEDLAHHYDWQIEKYHMPANISVNVDFESQNYENVKSYHGTDNGQLHIAYTIAANCLRFKWAVENNRDDLVKNATQDELLQAIRIVVNGGAPMSMKIAEMVLRFFKEKHEIIQLLRDRGKPVSPLTERQMHVLHGLCHGQTYEAIAWDLGIHKDTVGEHAKKIYKRLQAINVAEAAYRAGQLHIIKSDY